MCSAALKTNTAALVGTRGRPTCVYRARTHSPNFPRLFTRSCVTHQSRDNHRYLWSRMPARSCFPASVWMSWCRLQVLCCAVLCCYCVVSFASLVLFFILCYKRKTNNETHGEADLVQFGETETMLVKSTGKALEGGVWGAIGGEKRHL